MFGQFNRVPILDLPFNRNLLLQLKTETDLERLPNSDIVWTDPEIGVQPTGLVDLTVVDNDEIMTDEDGLSNTEIYKNSEEIDLNSKDGNLIDNTYCNHTDSFDSNAGGFIREEDSDVVYNAVGNNTDVDSIPWSLNSQSLPGKWNCFH